MKKLLAVVLALAMLLTLSTAFADDKVTVTFWYSLSGANAECILDIVNRYNEAFANVPELFIQKEIPQSDTTRHLYIIQLQLDKLTCTRREFFDAMAAENVQCQVHYVPVYYFPFYQKMGYTKGLCPNAEHIYKGIMSIPLYTMMTDEDVESVITAVKKIIAYYRK